jgi:hypothetical protein
MRCLAAAASTIIVNKSPMCVWWNNLERVLLAVDDLDCRALLG